jgi:hypothetical protein
MSFEVPMRVVSERIGAHAAFAVKTKSEIESLL